MVAVVPREKLLAKLSLSAKPAMETGVETEQEVWGLIKK